METIEEKNIRTDDISVSYTDNEKNTAVTVVFIHGFPLNKTMWDLQRQALGERFRVIAYDIRGFGNTEIGIQDFSIDLFATDLLRFLDKRQLNNVVLCGLSMGGYIAMRAAETSTARIIGLILCDTQCTADTKKARSNRIKKIDAIRRNGIELFADHVLSDSFPSNASERNSKELIEVRSMIEGTREDVLCNTLMALANRDEACSKLHSISIPTLILVGADDTVTPPARSAFMHERIAGSTLHTISQAGHYSNIDNPEEFNFLLADFLEIVALRYNPRRPASG
jgi:pimeloyl-ACP methyl ester carboxylesterase